MTEKKCHFIGVGGIGMSGLANIMIGKKMKVSGSDLVANPMTEKLSRKGADIYVGHDAQKILPDMTVVYSSGITADNPELAAAKELNCSLMHRSDILNSVSQGYKLLNVVGTHGKTTVSALLTATLRGAGLDPAFALGGIINQYGVNADNGSGSYFIAEGDESDGSFLKLNPYGAIITNIGCDHLDYFGSRDEIINSFAAFIKKVSSSHHLFWCGDNMYLQQMQPAGVSYGFCESCDLRALNFEQKGWTICFDIEFEEQLYRDVELPMIGAHNALNALAVFGLALRLGVAEEAIRAAFAAFGGVARRCEKVGDVESILVVDDYAHHPTEIASTLHALREAVGERRIIVIYEPHRYSRVRDCAGAFGGLFDDVDNVIVTEIYGAGEDPITGIDHELIIEENEQVSQASLYHIPFANVLDELVAMVRPHDVVITVGPGNVGNVGRQLVEVLKKKG